MFQRNVQWRSQYFKVGGHTGDVAQRVDAGVEFFGEGQRSGPPPHQLGGLGESVTTLTPPPPKKKKNLGFARIL